MVKMGAAGKHPVSTVADACDAPFLPSPKASCHSSPGHPVATRVCSFFFPHSIVQCLNLHRPPQYFANWAGWSHSAQLLLLMQI